MSNTIILIPSRMSAERLPGNPLLEVNGLPIICHVVKKAQETQIGEVVVATAVSYTHLTLPTNREV